MSSDAFYIRIEHVLGVDVEFSCLTGTAGGLSDLCDSRSFVLLLLEEALTSSASARNHELSEDQQQAEAGRLHEKWEASRLRTALKEAAEEDPEWMVSEEWMEANIDRFVTRCELSERRNFLTDSELAKREAEIVAAVGGTLATDEMHRWLPLRWSRCHNFTLRATAADPGWIEHLEEGLVFGTTAFDVWWEG